MSKRLLLSFIVLFFSCQAHALELGLGFMGVTPHYRNFREDVDYCREIGNTGMVTNWGTYVRIGGDLWSTTLFKGTDSICSHVKGLFINRKFLWGKGWDLSFIVGGYEFSKERWDVRRFSTPEGTRHPDPVYIRIGGTTFVPVLALGQAFMLVGAFGSITF